MSHPLDGQVVVETPEAYSEAALSTACPDDAIDLNRVNWGVTKAALISFQNAAQLLDQIKKSTVYGKPFSAVNNVGAHPIPRPCPVDPQVFHAIVGIATEAGELVQALIKAMYEGKPMDLTNLLEESGDVDWYQALLDSRIQGTQVKRWQSNRDKLARRYAKTRGDKPVFTAEAAITRDLSAERAILDQAGAIAPAIAPAAPAAPVESSEPVALCPVGDPEPETSLDTGDKADPVIVVHDDTPAVEAPKTIEVEAPKAVEVDKPAPKHGKGHGRK